MSFANAAAKQQNKTTTTNGMKAKKETGSKCVDLYFKIGASRGQNLTEDFRQAFKENEEVATRILLATRDVREGKGERQMFKDIFNYLVGLDRDIARRVLSRIPELGRWDDMLAITDPAMRKEAFTLIGHALEQGDGLCAKWMPRKGEVAAELRKHFGWTPKYYRKTLVNLTNVVETQMCEGKFDEINFKQVPSKAFRTYSKAFMRQAPEQFEEFLGKVEKGEAKINAGAIYPYDILKDLVKSKTYRWKDSISAQELRSLIGQWDNLPDFIGDGSILPMIDVSGSMSCSAGRDTSVTCMDVAVSLGLYCADKNTGAFKDTYLTFSSEPSLCVSKGDIAEKVDQVLRSDWGMSTNITAALMKVLDVAVKGKVSQEDMPKNLVIFSDMQFNGNWMGKSALGTIKKLYKDTGYDMPQIVFWNIHAYSNVPTRFDKSGVALVSGFSPSLVKTILECDESNFTPEGMMLKDVMKERYNF